MAIHRMGDQIIKECATAEEALTLLKRLGETDHCITAGVNELLAVRTVQYVDIPDVEILS